MKVYETKWYAWIVQYFERTLFTDRFKYVEKESEQSTRK